MTSAKRDVARDFRGDPIMLKPAKVRLALIVIIYPTVDAEGDALELKTWTTGITAAGAFKRWVDKRPHLPPGKCRYSVATEPPRPKNSRTPPVGRRQKSTHDTISDYLAATA